MRIAFVLTAFLAAIVALDTLALRAALALAAFVRALRALGFASTAHSLALGSRAILVLRNAFPLCNNFNTAGIAFAFVSEVERRRRRREIGCWKRRWHFCWC